MNPSLKLMLIIIITFEISFTKSIFTNLIIIGGCIIYLTFKKIKFKKLLISVLLSLILTTGILFSQILYGKNWQLNSVILISRFYAYLFLGLSFTLTTSMLNLALSLEQNLSLPSKLVYGVLGAFNLFPNMWQAIQAIKINSKMRGKTLHIWSPTLYYKALSLTINWANELTEVMVSHGFIEETKRTHLHKINLGKKDWFILIIILILLQLSLLISP